MTCVTKAVVVAGFALWASATASLAEEAHQWRNMDAGADGATFFDQKSLQQVSANVNRAVFAIAWKKPDDAVYPTFRIRNVSVVEETWKGDCAANTISLENRDYFAENGDRLEGVRASTVVPMTPKPRTPGLEILNLLCSRPQFLGTMFEGGPAALVKVVRETRVQPKPGG